MTESGRDQEPQDHKRISMQQAEDALQALGNLLYLLEIDHEDTEHLEAYLIMSRSQMEILNQWFYGDPCPD